jgi:transposase-like protein
MSREFSIRKQGQRTPEGQARQVEAVTHHGHTADETQTPEYRAWADMKNRCDNPHINNYEFYGARGITYCERWRSFENFLADMGARPSNKHSLGRKDNNGNYEPTNCEWQLREQQDNNRRDNVVLEYKGERLTLAQWARKLGLSRNTINARWRRGWNAQQIIEGVAPCGRRLPPKNSKRSLHAQEPPTMESDQQNH